MNFSVFSQTTLLSWNIRDFGKTKDDSEIEKIADIAKEFDIVAIQEVVAGYGGAQAVARLAGVLNRKGAKWDYVISDPTHSPPYKTERYAFLWKPHKIKALGRGRLVAELQDTVYREPFEMTFSKDKKIFKILNYHSRKYYDKPEEEIAALIQYIELQETPTILAGDFNLSEKHRVFIALYLQHYKPAVKDKKTTLKRKCKEDEYLSHSIDNIYLPAKQIEIEKGEVIDFVGNCNKLTQARALSDHLPVVVFFSFCK